MPPSFCASVIAARCAPPTAGGYFNSARLIPRAGSGWASPASESPDPGTADTGDGSRPAPPWGARAAGAAPRVTSSGTATVQTHLPLKTNLTGASAKKSSASGIFRPATGSAAPPSRLPRPLSAEAGATALPPTIGRACGVEGSKPVRGSLRLQYRCCGRAAAILNARLCPPLLLQGPAW